MYKNRSIYVVKLLKLNQSKKIRTKFNKKMVYKMKKRKIMNSTQLMSSMKQKKHGTGNQHQLLFLNHK